MNLTKSNDSDLKSDIDNKTGANSSTSFEEQQTDKNEKSNLSNSLEKEMEETLLLDRRFGRIAIKNKLVSLEDVKDALKKQAEIFKESKYIITIGDILVDTGLMTENYRDAIMKRQGRQKEKKKRHKSFGEIAIELGYLTQKDIDRAIALQSQQYKNKKDVKFLGDILIDLEVLTKNQRDMVAALRDEYRSGGSLSSEARKIQVDKSDIDIQIDGEEETEEEITEDKESEEETSEDKEEETTEDKEEETTEDKAEDITEDKKEEVPEDKLTKDSEIEDQAKAEEITVEVKKELSPFEREELERNKPIEKTSQKPEPAYDPTLSLKEHLDIVVSPNGMEAFFIIKDYLPTKTTLRHLKELIVEKKIKFGVLEDEHLTNYIQNKRLRRKPYKIAQGTLPKQPVNSFITYHFPTQQEKPGTIQDNGSIDFKNRGEVFSLKKGALLAEKTPAIDGKPGLNVYGNVIDVKRPVDVNIKYGKGVSRSPDGRYAFASVSGIPKFEVGGRIAVFPYLHIPGNVGMQTGHIVFEGIVIVSGEVSPGFRVQCEKLEARGIMDAEVVTTSDIEVAGGIFGSKIKCQGKVKANFIRGSKIRAKFGVIAQKEIIDCNIETDSKCISERGKILSSTIVAVKGINAPEIGSELSSESHLTTGFPLKAYNRISNLEKMIPKCTKDDIDEIKLKIDRIINREMMGGPDNEADIIVPNGISGAIINTRGKIISGLINNSTIESANHIVVRSEISKSTIETLGECNIQNGKILSSTIVAYKGVSARQIGTSIAMHSTIVVGVNSMVRKRLKTFKDSYKKNSEELEKLKHILKGINEQLEKVKEEGKNLGWIREYSANLKSDLKIKLKQLEKANDETRIKKVEDFLNNMDATLKADEYTAEYKGLRDIRQRLGKYFDRQKQLSIRQVSYTDEIKELEKDVKGLKTEIRMLDEITSQQGGISNVNVLGTIFSGNTVEGRLSSLKIRQNFSRVIIKEIVSSSGSNDDNSGAKMVVTRMDNVTNKEQVLFSTDMEEDDDNSFAMLKQFIKKDPNETKETKDTKEKKKKKEKKKIIILSDDKKNAKISGKVTATVAGLKDVAYPNAKISLEGEKGKFETTSDINGKFLFKMLEAGTYSLSVSINQYNYVTKTINIRKGQHLKLNNIQVMNGKK